MLDNIIGSLNDALYSYILIILLVVGGLYFALRTKFVQITMLPDQLRVVGEKPTDKKGVSGEDCGAEASKSIVIGIDNGAEYCGHEINAEIGIGVIGFSSTHTHLSEVDYSPIRCDSEHAYERKTVFNILSCPDTIHSNSVNIGPISIASNGDVSLSLQGSIFAIVGVGGSVGINLSEFSRGVFE